LSDFLGLFSGSVSAREEDAGGFLALFISFLIRSAALPRLLRPCRGAQPVICFFSGRLLPAGTVCSSAVAGEILRAFFFLAFFVTRRSEVF